MKITLEQWKAIESKVKLAKQAIEALEYDLLQLGMDHNQLGNQIEGVFLIELATKIGEATKGAELLPYFYHPQPEWMGGDSNDPKNFTTREPHIVGRFAQRLIE